MANTVLVSLYPHSKQPALFVILPDGDEEIDHLTEYGQYSIVATNKPESYTDQDAWEEYTYVDSDGYTQWRSNKEWTK